MTAFENAKRFFTACEASEGWEGCRSYVAEGATFRAQCEPLTEITTVQAYCDWMAAIGKVTAPGATYDLHSVCCSDRGRSGSSTRNWTGEC